MWCGHWELSELIQMLIGPKADWSRAFILLSTSHTLYLTGMSRIQFSIPSVPYLGTEYECATWLCFTAARSAYRWHTHARHKEMAVMPNVSIKGPKDRGRCLQNRPSPVCTVFENLKIFNVSHYVTSMTVYGRSLPDQEWAHSSPGQRHGRGAVTVYAMDLWMNQVRPRLVERQTHKMTHGLAALLLKDIVFTTYRILHHSKRPGSKICFHFGRWCSFP